MSPTARADDEQSGTGTVTGWKEKDDRTIAEMCEYMERERLDAFIPTKITHLAYLLNYYDPVHASILPEEMGGVLVVPKNGQAFLAGSNYHLAGPPTAATAPWWLKKRHGGGRPGYRAWEDAASLMNKSGLGKGRIGIERKAMSVAAYDRLRSLLPDAQFDVAD